jgi:EmrB/QacA subfamily drug resistance transporter
MKASDARRWWALGALVICLLTLGLDGTILNVALPTLATALGAGTSGLQWMVDAYVLVFAGLLLPLGAIGDRFGRKKVLIIGLLAFLAASVAAAYVTTTGQLVAARALMGFGSAIMTPVATAMIPVLFSPAERPRAIAAMAAAMGLGVPLGPIVGGYLLDHFWWGSIFLVNVPVAVLGLAAVALLVPETRDPAARPVDGVGAVLSTAGLITFVYGIIAAPRRGWGDAQVVTAVAAGVALLAAFVVWERRHRFPMIDLSLFARPRFLWGTLTATVATFALFGVLFTLPQFYQAVQGHDALATGLRLLPMMGGLVLGAGGSDRISRRVGTTVPVVVGLVALAVGLGMGARTGVSDPYGWVAAWLAISGFGIGLSLAPAMDAVLGELNVEQAGSGTALTMTLRQVGGALGVALLGSVLASVYSRQLSVGALPGPAADAARESVSGAMAVAARLGDQTLHASAAAAYARGMDVVLAVCAALALVTAVAAAVGLPARETTRPDADGDAGAEAASGEPESGHELSRLA